MCSAVVWNWLCSCPSARLPEPGPSLTLGESPDPKILPQEGGTEQSTGSSRYLSICPWPPYLASFFTRRGQTRFLLSFISISNMMSQREIICKGAGGSLHVAGLGGLGGVRKKRLQAWGKSFVEEAAPSLGSWEGSRGWNEALLLSKLLHAPAGAGRGNPGAERFQI